MSGKRSWERCRREGEYRRLAHGEAPGGRVMDEPDQGDVVPQGERLGVARLVYMRLEGGSGGGDVALGRAQDCRERCVRCAEDGEELSKKC